MDLIARIKALDPSRRVIVAVAGAPGSGKSTLAEKIVDTLNQEREGVAAVLPMDGFHYDDAILLARGWRPRKGAPHTFDVAGLFHIIERLKRNEEDEIAVPVFDRALELSRGSARIVGREVRIVVAEGNYLLLNVSPWTMLRGLFDLTVALDVPEAELRRRLIARWKGYNLTEPQIVAKLEGNDLPNGRLVRDAGQPADIVFRDDSLA